MLHISHHRSLLAAVLSHSLYTLCWVSHKSHKCVHGTWLHGTVSSVQRWLRQPYNWRCMPGTHTLTCSAHLAAGLVCNYDTNAAPGGHNKHDGVTRLRPLIVARNRRVLWSEKTNSPTILSCWNLNLVKKIRIYFHILSIRIVEILPRIR